jgi:hypothetical protein
MQQFMLIQSYNSVDMLIQSYNSVDIPQQIF